MNYNNVIDLSCGLPSNLIIQCLSFLSYRLLFGKNRWKPRKPTKANISFDVLDATKRNEITVLRSKKGTTCNKDNYKHSYAKLVGATIFFS